MNEPIKNTIALPQIADRFRGRVASILGNEQFRKNAVLVPLLQQNGQLCVLFEQRAKTLRRQPGEICFPGGRVEPQDKNPQTAALRETSEELNLPLHSIQYMGDLDILVTYSQMIVYPFVGCLPNVASIQPNPDEVEKVIILPLERLLAIHPERHDVAISVHPDENFPYHWIPQGKQYPWRTGTVSQFFYRVDEELIIWGLTARILYHFLRVIQP
ncbi:CoA pyrophosphatase [Fodinisporobacter ferrooxydans]|uniref:CoA pyrophosphatase n=1 Tax=Fodinisporobacter ferrooxydans TaxID=2901836 RepID=A0ABY4CQP8_9BACL|nr:CoA pyrophosphatase [Alicyclobacillaceae bacterium MYW30-H2]